jgi:hypothetical protein
MNLVEGGVTRPRDLYTMDIDQIFAVGTTAFFSDMLWQYVNRVNEQFVNEVALLADAVALMSLSVEDGDALEPAESNHHPLQGRTCEALESEGSAVPPRLLSPSTADAMDAPMDAYFLDGLGVENGLLVPLPSVTVADDFALVTGVGDGQVWGTEDATFGLSFADFMPLPDLEAVVPEDTRPEPVLLEYVNDITEEVIIESTTHYFMVCH